MTRRLYEDDPPPATALATVTRVRGGRFALDRTVFCPQGSRFRHHQRGDTGEVRVRGGARGRVIQVVEAEGEVWHRATFRPAVGDRVQCLVDAPRRMLDGRAHTALHLLLAALHEDAHLAGDLHVKGGGRFRLDLAVPVPPQRLAAALEQVRSWTAADLPVHRAHVPHDEAHRLTPQRFDPPDPWPGPRQGSWPVAEVPGVCAYPCDGAHAARTGAVGGLVLREARPSRTGMLVVGEVR